MISRILSVFLLAVSGHTLLASEGLISKSDIVKIQTARSDMRPWLNFNDGATRSTFNTAVHSQPLFIYPDLNISPGYIKKWKWESKENKYIFTIDTSLKYHNGKNVSAKDVELVFVKPFISPLTRANERIPLSTIKGISKLKVGMPFRSGILEGVKVINDDTIEIYLDSGHTRFLYSLGPLMPPLAPADSFTEDLYTFKSVPIGCGDYKVSFIDVSSSMVRVEKVDPAKKGPKYFEFYSDKNAWDNQVDIALGPGIYKLRKMSEEQPGKYQRLQGALPESLELLVFNFQTEAARNPAFREAVSLAFDRDQPFPEYPNQVPTGSILPILSYGRSNTTYKYDPVKAKSIFATLPKSIRDKEHVLLSHGTPGTDPARYYKEVAKAFAAIGMKVRLVLGEETNVADGDTVTTMVLFGRYVDSNPLITFSYYLPRSSHETIAEDKEYEKIFKLAEGTDAIDERAKYVQRLSEIINEKKIVIPYHQNYSTYYIGNRVKSLGLDKTVWNLNLANVELNN